MQELILNGKYNKSRIIIGKGILQESAKLCKNIFTDNIKPSKICVITDTNVENLYLKILEERLQSIGITIINHVLSAGEENKNLKAVSEIYNTLSNNQIGRNDMIIALGGGVTGDIAGFAASTYLRGIRYLVQIPTTLLSQVDSSVGGKCGVDLPQGKNLVGTFRQPDLVMIDPDVLKTLHRSTFIDGMAEVIKYGCIMDNKILEMIRKIDLNDYNKNDVVISELIERCIRIKVDVVEGDEQKKASEGFLISDTPSATGLRRLVISINFPMEKLFQSE